VPKDEWIAVVVKGGGVGLSESVVFVIEDRVGVQEKLVVVRVALANCKNDGRRHMRGSALAHKRGCCCCRKRGLVQERTRELSLLTKEVVAVALESRCNVVVLRGSAGA
jgi:hypothetical protein